MELDTIAAIATPLGVGGIGVVRVSGPKALQVAQQVVKVSRPGGVEEMPGYTCAYGRAVDEEGHIDEVVLTVFRAPRSYTGEDVAEIACHGGPYLLERVLRACCAKGARLAGGGEFTKRAFLNGKLDLTQAEAVMDLISAQGRQSARAALTARDGALSRQIDQVADSLIQQAGHLAAWIDYPEEEIELVDSKALESTLRQAVNQLDGLLKTYDTGRIFREGIEVAIVGRPNTGKSTLMNLLAGYDRSIVADLEGTTRDVVTDEVRLGDLILRLNDTAGIRETQDPIEQAGVRLAERQMEKAQLVLAVFDGSQPLSQDDKRVLESCQGLLALALVNKSDLPQRLELGELEGYFQQVITISAKSGEGASMLEEAIEKLFHLGDFDSSAAVLANERQREGVSRARRELEEALGAVQAGVSYDAVCVCVESAIDCLLELTGKKASQEVVNQVFSRFCVGK